MQRVNVWSFNFSIFCILLFLAAAFSGLGQFLIIGFHPLELLLYLTLAAFVFSVLGFAGIQNRMGLARSIVALVITVGLAGVLVYIVVIAKLLS